MEAFDLNGFAEGEELNPSAYNPEDYPTKEEMLDFIYSNSHKPPVNIDLKELSVNGLVKRDPMEMYLKSKHISSSNLKNALKTPRSFYYDYERVFEEKEKPCFQLGTFAHMAFLEPRLFELVKVEPKCNQSSKDGVIVMIKFYNELLSMIRTMFQMSKKKCPLKNGTLAILKITVIIKNRNVWIWVTPLSVKI